jgi:hypothetical protein
MLGSEAKNLLGAVNSQAVAWMEFVTRLVLWIFDCIAVNIFSLIRSRFGERFMTVVNWFFGAAIVGLVMLFATFAGPPKTLIFREIWPTAVFVCLLYHRWIIRKQNKAGVEWHSYSDGIPHILRIPTVAQFVSFEAVEKWIEPALVFATGYAARSIDPGLGLFLQIAAVSLCLRAYMRYYMERQRYLDARDARIEARYHAAAVQGQPASQTAGFTIAKSNRELIEQEERVAAVQTRLASKREFSDEVKGMLDPVLHTQPGRDSRSPEVNDGR